MIEGLKLHIKSTDLAALLEKRAQYHLSRADQKEIEIPKLRASLEAIDKPPPGASMTSNSAAGYMMQDPVESLRDQIKNHKLRAKTLAFYAKHVAPSETYVLSEGDLTRLEIVAVD